MVNMMARVNLLSGTVGKTLRNDCQLSPSCGDAESHLRFVFMKVQ